MESNVEIVNFIYDHVGNSVELLLLFIRDDCRINIKYNVLNDYFLHLSYKSENFENKLEYINKDLRSYLSKIISILSDEDLLKVKNKILEIKYEKASETLEKIEEKNEAIDRMYENVGHKAGVINSKDLYKHFDEKVKKLEAKLYGLNYDKKGFWQKLGHFFILKNGYTGKFALMIFINILFVCGLTVLIFFLEYNSLISLSLSIKLGISSLSILALLIWGTRYLNRKVHETSHLIEEYEHKSIVIKSLRAYGDSILALSKDDISLLASYLEKVGSTINRTPTHNLNSKNSDNSPVEDAVNIISAVSNIKNFSNK